MSDTPPLTDPTAPASAAATMAAAVGAATTGSDKPDNVKVSQPIHTAIWSLFVGLLVVCTFGMVIIGVLSDPFDFMEWLPNTQLARIRWLGWMGMVAIATVPLFAFALCSPWVGRVTATAGTNSVTLEGKTPAP